MPAKSAATRRTSSKPDQELPELTDAMLRLAVLKRSGKRIDSPPSENPKVAISLRLPPGVVQRWKATGAGWQTRMAAMLAERAP